MNAATLAFGAVIVTGAALAPSTVDAAPMFDGTLAGLDDLMTSGRQVGGWDWGDAAIPVEWGDATLVLYGDSLIDNTFVNNSAMLIYGGTITGTGTDNLVHTYTASDTVYWPTDGYIVPGTDRLVMPMAEVHYLGHPGESIFGFEQWDVDYTAVPDANTLFNGAPYTPVVYETGPWDNTPLGALNTVHVDSDPSIVNFEVLDGIGTTGFDGSYLARMTDVANPAAPWQWWNDVLGWQDDPLHVTNVAPDLTDREARVVNPVEHHGVWYALTWVYGLGAHATLLQAPDVTGPYLPVRQIDTDPSTYLHGLFVHDGVLAMRYSRNTDDPTSNVDMRPRFVEVAL